MDWKEYRQHLKEEWEFNRRNPELFIVWGIIVGWFLYCAFWKD